MVLNVDLNRLYCVGGLKVWGLGVCQTGRDVEGGASPKECGNCCYRRCKLAVSRQFLPEGFITYEWWDVIDYYFPGLTRGRTE